MGGPRVAVITASLLFGALFVGSLLLAKQCAVLTLTDGTLWYDGLTGRRMVARRGEGGVVRLRVVYPWYAHDSPFLCWLDRDGRVTLRLDEPDWDHCELDGLTRTLELSIEDVDEPMSPIEFRERFPGSLPWVYAHPWLVAVIVGTALVSFGLLIQRL